MRSKGKKWLQKIKKETFKNFCEGIRKNTNPSLIWKTVKRFKNKWLNTGNNNVYSQYKENTVLSIVSNLCPPWVAPSLPSFSDYAFDSFLDQLFNMIELQVTINNLRIKSSPSLDEIDYKLFVSLPSSSVKVLLEILNEIFISCTYPTEWKRFLVCFIPKTDSDKMRPISLASCTCKILEKLLCNRLNWWVEHHKFIPNSHSNSISVEVEHVLIILQFYILI